MSLKMMVMAASVIFGVMAADALAQDSSQFKYNYYFVIDPGTNGVDTYVSFKDTTHPEFVYLMLVASTNSDPVPTPSGEPTPVVQSHYDEAYRQSYNLRVNLYNSLHQLVSLHNAVNAGLKADNEFNSILKPDSKLTAVGRTAWIQLLKNDPQLHLDLQERSLVAVAESFLRAVHPLSPSLSERAALVPLFNSSAQRSLANWRAKHVEFSRAFEAL
jgi:hypothetical protein